MVMLSLDGVNRELDEVILGHLTLIQDYCNLSSELGVVMSRGFVQIAKSRMVLGQSTLQASSYFGSSEDAAEEALVTVKSNDRDHANSADSRDIAAPVSLCSTESAEEQKKHLARIRQKMGGLMAPGSLLLSQEAFSSALERSVELVSIQRQLVQGLSRYRQLMATKEELRIGEQ